MTVVFRVDASIEMGLGHIMRCLTLAQCLEKRGVKSFFISRDANDCAEKLFHRYGFSYFILSSSSNSKKHNREGYERWLAVDWEEDANDTLKVLYDIDTECEWLVVDHYALDSRWHDRVKTSIKHLLVIDDLANRKFLADLVVDQSHGRKLSDYSDLIPDYCRALLGSEYMLLRPEFFQVRSLAFYKRSTFKYVKKILVTMGGTDPKNYTRLVLDGLSGVSWGSTVPEVEVVLSSSAPYLRDIRNIAESHVLHVEVSLDVADMAKRMLESDLSIGASGATSWERCCLGLPSIILTTAENQKYVAKSLLDVGAAWGIEEDKGVIKEVARQVGLLCESPKLWRKMSRRAFTVTDGLGANRVVQQMYPMKAKDGLSVCLRSVVIDDVELLYQWQSNPNTRRYSNNADAPSFHEHVSWLRDRLKRASSLTQMIMHGDDPSGVIRLDPLTDGNFNEFIISIYVSPAKYRLGLGRASLEMLCEMMSGCRLLAQVHDDNDASHALFTSSGFDKIANTYYSKQV